MLSPKKLWLFVFLLSFSLHPALAQDKVIREIKGLKREVNNLKREVNNLKTQVSNLKREVENLKKEVSNLKEDMNELKREVAEIKGELRQMNKRFDDMTRHINERFADINKRIEELGKRIDDLKDVMLAMFAGLVVLVITVIGFAFWDRRTVVKKAVEESKAQIESEGKLRDVIRVLKELAKSDEKVANAMRKVGLL